MSMKTGQVILIMVFALTFALFSIFMLLAPIKDKLLRIKDMESVYQAIANSEKGLEISLLDVFKGINLDLQKEQINNPLWDCGGLNSGNLIGNCFQTTYQPIFGSLWTLEDKFVANNFIFMVLSNQEIKTLNKTISDGFYNRNIRTSFIGTIR